MTLDAQTAAHPPRRRPLVKRSDATGPAKIGRPAGTHGGFDNPLQRVPHASKLSERELVTVAPMFRDIISSAASASIG